MNKTNFIAFLTSKLVDSCVRVRQSDEDADGLIVQNAIDEATVSGITHPIGEDTDLLVLLCHHCKLPRGQLFLKSLRNNSKRPDWDIGHLIASLGPEICGILPFIHAIGGCDTTSRLTESGKAKF